MKLVTVTCLERDCDSTSAGATSEQNYGRGFAERTVTVSRGRRAGSDSGDHERDSREVANGFSAGEWGPPTWSAGLDRLQPPHTRLLNQRAIARFSSLLKFGFSICSIHETVTGFPQHFLLLLGKELLST